MIDPKLADVPTWLEIARREVGVKERRGKANNTRIMQYHEATRGGKAPDEVPWCASFVTYCLEKAGIRSTKSKAAASYATWGEPCMLKPGAIVVFGKSDPDAKGTGHVAFFVGWSEDKTSVLVLGGNQSNEVNVAVRPVSRIVAARWPSPQ